MVNYSKGEFELRRKLQEAYSRGRYLITVTSLNEKDGKLEHYHIWKEFPNEDLVPSLSHIANEIEGILSGGKEDNP